MVRTLSGSSAPSAALRSINCLLCGGHGGINSGPQVHRVQFLTAARFKVEEQLCPIGGAAAEDHVHDNRAPACFPLAKQVDLATKICIREPSDYLGIGSSLFFNCAKHLIAI